MSVVTVASSGERFGQLCHLWAIRGQLATNVCFAPSKRPANPICDLKKGTYRSIDPNWILKQNEWMLFVESCLSAAWKRQRREKAREAGESVRRKREFNNSFFQLTAATDHRRPERATTKGLPFEAFSSSASLLVQWHFHSTRKLLLLAFKTVVLLLWWSFCTIWAFK